MTKPRASCGLSKSKILRALRLILFGMFYLPACFSQTLPNQVNFTTPEVASFNRSLEVPVSLFTGTPSISIPLYEINVKGATIPITLDYHAGGIRVDQEATWVGLGWSLNYGGQISRTVRGAPDEKSFFYGANQSINTYLALPNISQDPFLNLRGSYLADAKAGLRDFMPDAFQFSALGYGGKFLYNQETGKFVVYPKEDIVVAREWSLTLPNGVIAQFGDDACTALRNSNGVGATKQSWSLKKIITPFGDAVDFLYTPFTYSTFKISGQTYSITNSAMGSGSSPNTGTTNATFMTYDDVRIQTISFRGGKVVFTTEPRTDLPNSQALSKIEVFDAANNLVRRIKFLYSYFVGTSHDVMATIGYADVVPTNYRHTRLKLDHVEIEGTSTTDGKLKYSFDYFGSADIDLPSKYSFSQDHWGFFNGAANVSQYSFIPNIMPQSFTGGKRSVDPNLSKAFTLRSITYPEGGTTQFEYENNTAGIWSFPSNLLTNLDDPSFAEKTSGISISSYSRLTSNPLPDEVQPNGIRVFKKQFTVSEGLSTMGFGWDIYTNFGMSSLENDMIYSANNVEFKLEKLNTDGSRTLIRNFNTTSQQFPYVRSGTDKYPLNISDGTYEMSVAITYSNPESSSANNQPYNLSFIVKWREIDKTKYSFYSGGLRVKEIRQLSSEGSILRYKRFKYENPYARAGVPTFSSGRVVSLPAYVQQKVSIGDNGGTPTTWYFYCNSFSTHPLETIAGSYSGYEYVNEIDVDPVNEANNVFTEYHYSFDTPYFSEYYPYMHFAVWEPKEWNRGKLLWKALKRSQQILRKEEYTYYNWSPHLQNEQQEDYVQEINTDLISHQYIQSISSCLHCMPGDFYDVIPCASGNSVGFLYGADNYSKNWSLGSYQGNYCPWDVKLPYFKHYTGFDRPQTKTITTLGDDGQSSIVVENYFYGSTPQLHQLTETRTLNSNGENVSQLIKYPYHFSSSAPYNSMLAKNMVSYPVEEQKLINNTFVSSKTTNYFEWNPGLISPSSIQMKNGSGQPYPLGSITKYDQYGNILEQQASQNVKHSYLWGYNGLYPVAEVVGADHATISALVNQTVLDNTLGQYSDVDVRNELQKLRTGLAGLNVSITTYTYKPQVGITSITDSNGVTQYYTHDTLGRLVEIRDKDGNILKTVKYHYANRD